MAFDEAGIDVAGNEVGRLQAAGEEPGIGLHRPDFDRVAGLGQFGQSLLAGFGMGDQLGDHRVVERRHLATLLDAGVGAHGGRKHEVLEPAGGRQEPSRWAFGVEPGLHRVAGQADLVLAQRQRLAGGHAQLPFHEVQPGHHLSHRMLHLQAGVHFHEPDAVGAQAGAGVGDELHGAGADVVHGLGGLDGGLGDSGAGGGVHARRGRLLDHLLVAALQGAVALIEVDHVALAVAEHLHLDVARPGDIGLQQHALVAEGRAGLAPARRQGGGEVGSAIHPTHALAAAAGHRLDQYRIADARGLAGQGRLGLVLAEIARRHRHAGLVHQRLGGVLQAHGADRGAWRADPDQAGGGDRVGEGGVLREEAVARMDGLGAGFFRRGDDLFRDQIAFPRRGRPDQHGPVGVGHMGGVRIGLRIDGHGLKTHAPRGGEHPAGDLSAVGDQDGSEHGHLQCAVARPTITRPASRNPTAMQEPTNSRIMRISVPRMLIR